MSSAKKRNKQAKAAKQSSPSAGKPFRHPDGFWVVYECS